MEGATLNDEMLVASGSWKRQENTFSLEPPERDLALLTLTLVPEAYVAFLTYRTMR